MRYFTLVLLDRNYVSSFICRLIKNKTKLTETKAMGRYTGKTCRLLTMLSMTGSFFLVEIIVGYITNSIALVADSFHMLSDVVALIVGFASVRVSTCS